MLQESKEDCGAQGALTLIPSIRGKGITGSSFLQSINQEACNREKKCPKHTRHYRPQLNALRCSIASRENGPGHFFLDALNQKRSIKTHPPAHYDHFIARRVGLQAFARNHIQQNAQGIVVPMTSPTRWLSVASP